MEGMKLCRILNPVVHGLFSLCNCSTSQLPLFLPSCLMATATCCHLPLLTSSNQNNELERPSLKRCSHTQTAIRKDTAEMPRTPAGQQTRAPAGCSLGSLVGIMILEGSNFLLGSAYYHMWDKDVINHPQNNSNMDQATGRAIQAQTLSCWCSWLLLTLQSGTSATLRTKQHKPKYLKIPNREVSRNKDYETLSSGN